MRMTIIPKSFWVAYTLLSGSTIQDMLPSHLQLAPVKLLADEKPHEPLLLFNAYNVQAQWMRGKRVDVQVFARHRITNTPHLVILDVRTTTMDWNPQEGIKFANARSQRTPDSDFRITYDGAGEFSVGGLPRRLQAIDRDFAVEANRVCYFRGIDTGYPMTFDEESVAQAVEVFDADVNNTLWSKYRSDKPTHVFAHTQPMVFDVHVGNLPWG